MNNEIEKHNHSVLGQKYAFATVSLVLGIACFVNLLGLEKAILAIIFGWLALRRTPEPLLVEHRTWAKAGIVLGILPLVILPILIIFYFDRLVEIIELLSKLSGGR
jgi:hypothetical protein